VLQRVELDAGQPDGARVELRLRNRILKVVFPQLAQRLFEEWGRRKRVNRPPTSADRAKIREAAIGILFRSLLTHCAESRSLPPVPVARLFSRPVAWLTPKTLSRLRLDRSEFSDQRFSIDFGSLDARCLGSIYESLLNIDVLPAGPRPTNGKVSARKASGTYYTPPAIVEYLVANTVGPVLDRKLDALRLKIDAPGGLRPGEYASFVAQLFDVKVLDPAMGCGHFLVQTVNFIVGRLTDFLNNLPEGALDAARLRRVLAQTPAQIKLSDSQLIRRHVLERCVYGVDRDPFAVGLAKATLWLDAGLIGADWRSLDEHLRCGDALTGNVRSSPRRQSKAEKPRAFDWDSEFADVFRASGSAEAAACGFDCVVGNPPYVRIQNLDDALVERLKSSFQTIVGKFDLYLPFLERGIDLLGKEGQLGMIVPNKLLTANYGAAFRKHAAGHRLVRQIVDFECQQVFPGASTYCCLLFLSREAGDRVTLSRGTLEPPIAGEATCLPAERLGMGTWSVKTSGISAAAGKPLKSACRAIFQGLITGGDRLLIGRREGDWIRLGDDRVEFDPLIFRAVLKGPDVRRYSLRFSEHYALFPYREVDGRTELLSEAKIAKEHPAVFRYLERHRSQLERRGSPTMVYPAWYAHWCPRSLARFNSPKIVTQVLASRASFALDRDGTYAFVGGGNAGVYGILATCDEEDRLWLLLAILNSRTFDAQLQSRSSHFRGGYFSYARRFIENVAIPPIAEMNLSAEPIRAIINLAKQRAESPPKWHNRLEAELDGAVDELYRCGIR
jgi:Eco57I restriction-modification methylase/TaqI-like C-terminal specificity domain